MIIGFTGTRNGMSTPQRIGVERLLQRFAHAGHISLQGDCIGADQHFDELADHLGYTRLSWPCTFTSMRAYTSAFAMAPPLPPMQRNAWIVKLSHWLIGCPPNDTPVARGSGTWATIRMAERDGSPRCTVYPDGRIEQHGDVVASTRTTWLHVERVDDHRVVDTIAWTTLPARRPNRATPLPIDRGLLLQWNFSVDDVSTTNNAEVSRETSFSELVDRYRGDQYRWVLNHRDVA